MTSISSTTNPFPPSSFSRKHFKFYRNANKKVCDNQGFRVLIKNHTKNLQAFEIKQYRLPFPNSSENNILQEEILRSLRKTMKQNKSLSTLKFFIHGTKPFYTESLLSDLKSLRSLSTFHLKYIHSDSLTSDTCQSLTHCLKNLKQLIHIDSNLYSKLRITGFSRQNLRSFRHLSCLKALNILSMNSHGSQVLNEKSSPLFSSYLKRLASLKSISLNLLQSHTITRNVSSNLSKSLGNLSLLEALNLQVGEDDEPDSLNFVNLFENLKDLPHFQELSLGLIERLTDNFLVAGLSLLDHGKLKKLSIEFSGGILDSQLSNFFCVLQKFSSLTYLNLTISNTWNLTSQGFSNLLLCAHKLQHLSFKFVSQADMSSILCIISLYLQKLENLTSFKIYISGNTNIEDISYQKLFFGLSNSSKLRNLRINFERCQSFRDKSLENLAQVLKEIPNLQYLGLSFEGNKQIHNEAVINLMSSFGNLQSLKRLSLNFLLCLQVNVDCFGVFMESLELLNSLNKMNLGFGNFSAQLQTERYKELIEYLGKKEALTEVTLQLLPSRSSKFYNVKSNSKCINFL